jgi:rhodanese-related sulfurtransferase
MPRRTDPPDRAEVDDYFKVLKQITCAELAEKLASGAPGTILDVRTEGEWIGRRIPGAVLVPLQQLDDRLEEVMELPGPLYVHCEHGVRSMDASLYLIWQGRRDVHNVREGLCAWRGPTESGPRR